MSAFESSELPMSPTPATSAAATTKKRGLYGLLATWLSASKADRVIVVLGFALLLPSLNTGLAADDYLQTVMLDRPSPIAGFERAPLDLFRFCDPRQFKTLLDQGIFSWWDDPQTRLAFLRPLTAATHAFDHAFFRNQGVWLHLHSALWSLVLFLGVRALYRNLINDRLLANLALALYALDDARGWLVSWVAARNAAIATGLSVWCLVLHHLGRSGQRHSLKLALAATLFAFALLSGEGSIAIFGYLLGYAWFLDRGSVRARLWSLAPYAAIVVIWRVIYVRNGFGVYGSSLYTDPIAEPRAFLATLLQNGPLLLGSQFGGMWSDVSTLFFVAPRLRWVFLASTFGLFASVMYLLRPQLKASALARFALVGMLCSVFPAVTAAPAMDRLLTWVAIGASILTAQLIAPVLRDPASVATDRTRKLTVAGLVAAHLLGAVFLPSRARGNLVMRDTLGRADVAIPHDASVRDKTLIFVNPPLLPYAAYIPIERAALGVPRPRAQHILAIATTELTVERTDAYTLRLSPREGFLLDPVSRLLWSEHRPFHVGEQIVQGDMTVTVLQITPDHRPKVIETRFAQPLEASEYVWVDWRGASSSPFVPPVVGTHVVLPAADYFQSVLGTELPIKAQY
jgi:hypothetical protein